MFFIESKTLTEKIVFYCCKTIMHSSSESGKHPIKNTRGSDIAL